MSQNNLRHIFFKISFSVICLLAAMSVAAQDNPSKVPAPQDNPFSAHNWLQYAVLKHIVLESAEKMPEENYGFKPTEIVRSYGKILGHIADAQYFFCSAALGQKSRLPNVEKTKTSKSDLIAALKESFAYCDQAYDPMTDAAGLQMVKLMGTDTPKLAALMNNNAHTSSHYGNLVTYLRMKNVVPPSSEPGFVQQMQRLQQKK